MMRQHSHRLSKSLWTLPAALLVVWGVFGAVLPALRRAQVGRGVPATRVISQLAPGTDASSLDAAAAMGNWQAVLTLLRGVRPTSGDPVPRLLKAHACLALNRGNDAMALFLAQGQHQQLLHWQQWCSDLVRRQPQAAGAQYLSGDAFARLEHWPEALAALDRAIALDSGFVMAKSAKAAVMAAAGKWDEAIVLSEDAAGNPGAPADAFATRGALNVMRSSGPDGALVQYNEALNQDPKSALLRNGRGCAYYGMGEWDKAESDFRAAERAGLPLARSNRAALLRARLEIVAAYAKELARKPGTSIEARRKFEDLSADARLKIRDISEGQARMNEIYSPVMYALKGLPFVGGAAEGVLDAYQQQSHLDDLQIRRLERGTPPGGVTASMTKAFVDKGHWPVITWVNLCYAVRPPAEVK